MAFKNIVRARAQALEAELRGLCERRPGCPVPDTAVPAGSGRFQKVLEHCS